jgi:tRNA (guanine-N7-)-methyltransferase
MTRAQRRALEILWPKYGIGDDTSLLNGIGIFGDQRPLILEIGFGNGDNLVDLALAHPNQGYIGVDVYRPGAGRLMLALDRLEINNVRILLQDAAEVLLHRFAKHSLDSILIYFPDPWPKKRHHKRRILCPDFLHNLALCLKPRGFLHIATDCNHYGQTILEYLALEPLLTNLAPLDKDVEPLHRRTITKYEARGIERGHPIVNISARRA